MSFSLYALLPNYCSWQHSPFTKSGIRIASLELEIYVPKALLEQTFSSPHYQFKIMTISGQFYKETDNYYCTQIKALVQRLRYTDKHHKQKCVRISPRNTHLFFLGEDGLLWIFIGYHIDL